MMEEKYEEDTHAHVHRTRTLPSPHHASARPVNPTNLGRVMGDATGPASTKPAELDVPLSALGFEMEEVSPSRLTGRLVVTDTCCQPFKVLHGGVSALIAEGLASTGAHMASGYRRVAGMQPSINHFRSAATGDTVLVRAVPVHIGRFTQVWEVKLWKMDAPTQGEGPQIAEARVTLLCNLPVPDEMKSAGESLRKYSKL
ncbi:1,4-dihydroxy-2-naphthoyl-CoA thioesterase 1-like [Triticum dicoccoides]|uniref:1,4-dihydroxy-2-naphthoyl-CoA thioesterase 1-like n=1 Tax=Triticum dicoccoides TaxID=85692 RepID=UPI00188E3E1D|nr:1,4-dihydroxy-2-naphthoyl-CoA thioesterase 1-like [Triticum dicoccoides]